MVESIISADVYIQVLYVYTGLSPIFGRYCIIISSCCIFNAIDYNFDLFWNSISINNGSGGCYFVVVVIACSYVNGYIATWVYNCKLGK